MKSTDAATRSPGAGRRGAGPAHWPITFALLLLLLAGNGALGPLLLGTSWWWLMALVAAAVLLSLAGLRRLGVTGSYAPVAGFGVLVATVTLLFGGGSGLLWLVPSLETLDRFQGLVGSGIDSIQGQGTPAEPTPGILFLLCVGAGVIAILMDTLAIVLRTPALAGLPALVPVAVPGIVLDEGADHLALILTAAAFLVLLRVDVRVRRAFEAEHPPEGRDAPRVFAPVRRRGPGPLGGAIVVGGIGIVSALVLSLATPDLPGSGFAGTRPNGSILFGSSVSPMINLGRDLRRPEAGAALHYRTTADKPPYLKLLTLDEFAGTTWTARAEPANTANGPGDIARPPGLSSRIATTETTTQIVIDGVATPWLPAPAAARKVSGLVGAWYWDGPTGTIVSTNSTTRGQTYTVTALEIAPTAEQLRESGGRYPVSVERALSLPQNRPALIEQTAREVTAGAASAYDAAVALQEYLRGSEFTYDTQAPVEDGYDGGGIDVVGTFLEVKRGYCVHFASAMAVMARSIGIPARIAIGYLPGSRSSSFVETRDRFNVDAHDLHAWPELYFVGVGWVPFEPTPGRGTVPDYTRTADGSVPLGGSVGNTPTGAPRAVDPGGQNSADGPGGPASQDQGAGSLLRLGLSLAAVLAVLLLPGGMRALRRARRRRRIHTGPAGAAEAWDELADTAVDHGVRVRSTETPRELAARLAALPGLAAPPGAPGTVERLAPGEEPAAALERLLVAAERHRYARPDPDRPAPERSAEAAAELLADLDRVIRALHGAAEPMARWRATALPASLSRPALDRRNGRSRERVESPTVSKFKKTPYKVDVRDLINRPGTMHERHLEIVVPEDLGESLVAVKAGSTLVVNVRLEALHEGILVSAQVSGIAAGECGRCLIDVELPVQVEFHELFAYSLDEAYECEVQDDHVDLEPLIRDAVVLSLPFQPVCRPDCPGLDPETGQRLAEAPEFVPEEMRDPRWAALLKFQASESIGTDEDIQAETDREEK